ncbi:MAG: N-acetylneuraminate synthase [Crocinitomicaceae bacterium]|jgi:N-acetylneuraminate synthase/N,N'-diacetyllegionaminate synthase|tara:strand:- start:37617 stop:38639 length:1023 start_codon:yes stop_codon:yes gene_type:complete
MKQVLIIAEAGVNHNGDLNLAKKLIDAAAEAKVNVVKFQTFKTEKLVSKKAKQAAYQAKNLNIETSSQFEMLKKLELPQDWHYELKAYAEAKKLVFLSTGFDPESLDFLESLNPPFFKIPSGEITNKPYLIQVSRFQKPIVLSTGMCNLTEIKDALEILTSNGVKKEEIRVLHCNTEYPTPFQDVNLKAMLTIKEQCNVDVGYSDHTLGIEVSIAAVALGATVIEKHFTLSRDMEGPDHAASLEPDELKHLVSGIRNVEKAIQGDGQKQPSASELKNKAAARKSLHTSKDLEKGTTIKASDIEIKRPGDGINPMQIDSVIGKNTNKSLEEGSKLKWEDLD